MKNMITIAMGLSLFAACSSQKVNFDYDRQADFSSYQTYAWYQGDNTLADEFPLAHQRFTAAVDQQLSRKGLRKVDSSPDVYVTYFGEDQENVTIDTDHFGYGLGTDWYWGGGMGMTSSTSRVRTYTTGTLVVDIWDASKKQLVWRGIVSDTVSDNPGSNEKKLQSAAVKMFENYPPSGS